MEKLRPIRITWTGGMVLSPDTTKVVYYDHQKTEVGVYDLVANVNIVSPSNCLKALISGSQAILPGHQMDKAQSLSSNTATLVSRPGHPFAGLIS